MNDTDELLQRAPYSAPESEKGPRLLAGLKALTRHHYERCPEYAKVLDFIHPRWESAAALHELPYLPVSLFKQHTLKSVPDAEVYKVLKSSGTTAAQPSRVTLDRPAAERQSRALGRVITHELGPKRRPMIVVDSADFLTDRRSFNARAAGILGLSTFGRDHFYALRSDLSLDEAGLRRWLERHPDEPLFVFGFTFLIWRFAQALAGRGLDLSRATLIHSGGWKKMQSEAVGRERFRQTLKESAGIAEARDFYGMVEQIGSIFLECGEGVFHAPLFADVLIRDPHTWRPAARGQTGVVEVFSLLPSSYPGHCLLTEDMGALAGVDDCPCGRLGRTFTVSGRLPKAEARGCSDTRLVPGAS